MTKSIHPARQSQPKRWLALLLASLLLHGAILHQAGWQIGVATPALPAPSQRIVTAQLQLRQAQAPAPVSAPRKVQKPVAKPKPKPKPNPKPKLADVILSAPQISEVAPHAIIQAQALAIAEQNTDQMAGMEVPGSSIEPAIVLTPDDMPAARTEPDAEVKPAVSALQQAIDPPPPVLLKYDVQSKKDGKSVYGSGKISWQTDGNAYAVKGEASVLFFTVLEFRSEGAYDSFGVAPLLYSEKRFRKSATNTHFRSDPKVVSFSASTLTYPRQGGEQDRASVMWQLAALGRGNSKLFVPGMQIEIMVAGVRDAETWHIRVIGLEQIQLPAGQMAAWHLERQPRAASFDQRIEFWLAPQYQWYPVRLRYTENNGDYLDMAASVIEPIASLPTH
ncbi:MAG: DUF3108 domain-containing protein [Burkholderiaceae bacterium]